MNVDELQKINALARELLNHKIAANNEEATEKAKQMIQGEKDTSQKTIAETAVEEEQQVERRDHGEDINKLQNTVSYMTSDFKALADEFKSLQTKYETLRQDLIEVKRAQSQATQPKQEAAQPEAQPAEQAATPSQPQQEGTEARPRTGEVTPEDVSVEKVFYFGQK